MDFLFSEREEMLRKSVREFAENELPPRMEAMEETEDPLLNGPPPSPQHLTAIEKLRSGGG